MLNIGELSVYWIEELNVLNNQLKIKALALDKIIQIECSVIIFMSLSSQDETVMEVGNTVEVVHKYRALNSDELEQYELYNYNPGDFCHIIDFYGDYMIKIICNDVSVTELGEYKVPV